MRVQRDLTLFSLQEVYNRNEFEAGVATREPCPPFMCLPLNYERLGYTPVSKGNRPTKLDSLYNYIPISHFQNRIPSSAFKFEALTVHMSACGLLNHNA